MNPFSTKGRISIKEFIWNIAISIGIYIEVVLLTIFLTDDLQVKTIFFYCLGFIILFIGVIYFLISMVCLTVRRFQDMGKPGSTMFMLFIPLYNLYLIALLFSKVEFGRNTYGPEIIGNTVKDKVYAVRLGIIILVLFVSNLAIDSYNDRISQRFADKPEKNDLYIIEITPVNGYSYRICEANNIIGNRISLNVGTYMYVNIAQAKKAIDDKAIQATGYFDRYEIIGIDSLKSKRIKKIIRYCGVSLRSCASCNAVRHAVFLE